MEMYTGLTDAGCASAAAPADRTHVAMHAKEASSKPVYVSSMLKT